MIRPQKSLLVFRPATPIFFWIVMLGNFIHIFPAPQADAREAWKARDSGSPTRVDHGKWQAFLAKYLDTASGEANRVRYGQVTGKDKQSLEAYLSHLQREKVSHLPRQEQKAYWINLYNATTVAIVLRHYPVKSIRDIDLPPGGSHKGPWDAAILEVEGHGLSLNDIENRILRPVWKDNLIHFGLNCASLGCPDLAPVAFTAENTDRLLEKGARGFINSRRGAAFADGGLTLSSIFDWYRGDFGKDDKEVFAFLSRFAAPPLRERLEGYAGKIHYQYDWTLNDASGR